MAVYTLVSKQDVATFLQHYPIGELLACSGIEEGIENSNYRLETTAGRFILTLYESLADTVIVSIIQLMRRLNESGFPAPMAIADNYGHTLHYLNGRPAAVFYCLPGVSAILPTDRQCHAVGRHLAVLHKLGPQLNYSRNNARNLKGCRQLFRQIQRDFSARQQCVIQHELTFQAACQQPGLPRGVIHADLFRDNVLFERDKISGVLDFYTVCEDVFILDLAITCNDWCVRQGQWRAELMQAVIDGYQSIRSLTRQEKALWPVYCRFAALRFWLSRRYHQVNPREGAITQNKDPDVFWRLLEYHIAQTQPIDSLNPIIKLEQS